MQPQAQVQTGPVAMSGNKATEQCEDGSKRRRMRARARFSDWYEYLSQKLLLGIMNRRFWMFLFFFLAALDAAFPALGHPTQAEPLAGRA